MYEQLLFFSTESPFQLIPRRVVPFKDFSVATTHDHFKQRYSNLKTKSKIHLKGFLDIRNQRDRNVEPKPAMSYVILLSKLKLIDYMHLCKSFPKTKK
jgi:hypothetical protein